MKNNDIVIYTLNEKDYECKLGYFALKYLKAKFGLTITSCNFEDVTDISKIIYSSIIKKDNITFAEFEKQLDDFGYGSLYESLSKVLAGLMPEEKKEEKEDEDKEEKKN